ncbi:hypothetical protein EMCRGX_G004829 [Ephydatia muelleri]
MSIRSNSGTNFASRWGTWCECLKRPLATGVYPVLLYCGVGDQGEDGIHQSLKYCILPPKQEQLHHFGLYS